MTSTCRVFNRSKLKPNYKIKNKFTSEEYSKDFSYDKLALEIFNLRFWAENRSHNSGVSAN